MLLQVETFKAEQKAKPSKKAGGREGGKGNNFRSMAVEGKTTAQ